MMNLAAKNDTRADIGGNVDVDKALFPLRSPAITLTQSGKIRIVFNDNHAIDDTTEQGMQRNGTPVFKGADRQDDSILNVCNGGNSNHHREQFIACLPMLPEQATDLNADETTDRPRCCFVACEQDLCFVQFRSA